MRIPTSRARSSHARLVHLIGAAMVVGVVVSACSVAAAPSVAVATPTPVPSPAPTPVPHLADHATADQVYLGLRSQGLAIVPNTASTGGPGRDPVKQIQATYAGWPLAISEYMTAKSLAAATRWKPARKPGRNEAPIAFLAGNILVEWGPLGAGAPPRPTEAQLTAAQDLRVVLDLLLAPLTDRTIVPVRAPVASPAASPVRSPAGSPAASASGAP